MWKQSLTSSPLPGPKSSQLLTAAQTDPKQWVLWKAHPPVLFFLLRMTLDGVEYILVTSGQLPWLCLLPASCAPPAYLRRGRGRNRPWSCTSTAQQQLKHGCVFNVVLVTNLKQYHVGCCEENLLHPSQTQYNLHPLLHTICIILRSYSMQDVSISHFPILCHVHRYSCSLWSFLRIGVH